MTRTTASSSCARSSPGPSKDGDEREAKRLRVELARETRRWHRLVRDVVERQRRKR